ncbi:hypothetical protein [Thioalkalivibrio sulfidiphilus]|uniref:hypothetical protein n=1 Tax=Thioalkalivibrio sulfidiphilus TaxID=1033854 RepID=UPI00036A16B3|nr:hypothetical protein [Thioalkalivibrio sulfidiphilus]
MSQENHAREIALQWIDAVERTARALDHPAHMDLVSKRVRVLGIPGFEAIGYDDWFRQCEHEFKDRVLKDVSYTGLRMRAATDRQIMFQTVERVEANDGTVIRRALEVVLDKESDGKWRVLQQRIMLDHEAMHYGLLDASSS